MAGTISHKWNGTILEITSDSGTSAMDLRGAKGDTGARGVRGLPGERGGGAAIEDGIISTETTWSSAGIMENFAEHMSVSGNPVSCNPIPNYPLHIITDIEPKQSGSGEPSPSNIRPISGMDAVSVVRCGKNLLQNTATTKTQGGITFTVNNDGSVKAKGTASENIALIIVNYVAGYRTALSAGTYTVSGNPSNEYGMEFVIYDSQTIADFTYMYHVKGGKGTTFTIDKTMYYGCYYWIPINSVIDVTIFPQLEASTTATTYEPYNGNTFTVSIGETVYSGSLDWNTGELTVNKKAIVLNGGSNEKWVNGYIANGKDNRFEVSLTDTGLGYTSTSKAIPMDDTICDTFGYQSTTQIPATSKYRISQNGTSLYLLFNPPTSLIPLENLTAWKTWLASNPITVILPVAEPYTIQLTPQEIKAIKGQNTLYTDAANIQVIGRVDTMYQLSMLAERVAALEAALINA